MQAFHRSKAPASMICVLSCSIEAITRLQPTPGTTRPTYAQAMPSGITAMMPNLRGAARMALRTSCKPRPTCSSTSNASYGVTKRAGNCCQAEDINSCNTIDTGNMNTTGRWNFNDSC